MGEQTLRPLTVKQIKNCEIPQDQTFRVDGSDVTQVSQTFSPLYFSDLGTKIVLQTTFVGVIRGVQELATNYVYTVEDGTGAIEVRKWVEQNETAEEADARRAIM